MKNQHEAALCFLENRPDFERRPMTDYVRLEKKLERLRRIYRHLGRPGAGIPVVHVAGSKGKGSVCCMIEGILRRAGLRLGLFLSPHLHSLTERFQIAGRPIALQECDRMILALKECLETIPEAGTLTYFDVLTLSALHYFEREKVDGIVLEVGLGGRFDSTNICRPDVSVITGISLEHTELLGDTLAAIAGEKAGIIRPGVSVVSGVVEDEPRTVIRRIASERKSPLYEIDTDYQTERTPGSGPCRFLFSKAPSGALSITGFRPGMPGVHQERNAAVAAAAVELLVHTVHQDRQAGWRVTPENIRDGIASAVLPGRIEQLSDRPILIVDGAHNPASAEALVEVLRTLPGATGRRHLLFGAMSDKDVVGMLSVLLPFFDRVVFTRISGNPRAFSAEELAGLATVPDCGMRNETTIDFTVLDDPAKAFRRLQKEAAPDDLICVAGSLYLAAEIRSLVPVPGDQRSTVNT